MASEKKYKNLFLILIISMIYLVCFFALIELLGILLERTFILIAIGIGFSGILCSIIESRGNKIERMRYLPIQVAGIKFSITIFAVIIFILKPFVG